MTLLRTSARAILQEAMAPIVERVLTTSDVEHVLPPGAVVTPNSGDPSSFHITYSSQGPSDTLAINGARRKDFMAAIKMGLDSIEMNLVTTQYSENPADQTITNTMFCKSRKTI